MKKRPSRPPEARPGSGSGSLPEWAAVSAVVAAGAALRVWMLGQASGLTMDSPLYVRMAEQVGGALAPLGPAHHGYPVLIRIASLFIAGREWPGRCVSFVAGLALIVITFLIARRK